MKLNKINLWNSCKPQCSGPKHWYNYITLRKSISNFNPHSISEALDNAGENRNKGRIENTYYEAEEQQISACDNMHPSKCICECTYACAWMRREGVILYCYKLDSTKTLRINKKKVPTERSQERSNQQHEYLSEPEKGKKKC